MGGSMKVIDRKIYIDAQAPCASDSSDASRATQAVIDYLSTTPSASWADAQRVAESAYFETWDSRPRSGGILVLDLDDEGWSVIE
jgi:hypothetical protein